MRASITVSRISLCLLIAAALSLCPAPSAAAPTMQWDGDQTVAGSQSVTGNQTVSGVQYVGNNSLVQGSVGINTVLPYYSLDVAGASSHARIQGGLNVGQAAGAAAGQIRMKSNTDSPSLVWHSVKPEGYTGSLGFYWPTAWTDNYNVWTNEGNALRDDDGGAYASTNNWAGYGMLKLSNFHFTIPAGASINGVEASCRVKGTTGFYGCFQLINSSGTAIGQANHFVLNDNWQQYTFGSPSYTWDATLTDGIVNSPNFGVQVWLWWSQGAGGNEYLWVDYAKLKIYYSMGVTQGLWTAGSYWPDGSWRLANALGSLNTNISLAVRPDGNVGIGTAATSYPLQLASGAYCSPGGTWTDVSSRSRKLNIAPVPLTSAWELLDQLQPVDFEYRKTEKQFRLVDGSLARTAPVDPRQVLEEVTVWTEEGSGERHRGFIAEELPAQLARKEGVAAIDIAANNTAALKEAKRRIEELARQMAASAPAGSGAAAVGAAGSGAPGVSDLSDASDLSDKTIQRLTESVLKKIGVDPWAEITAAEAWEEVDETAPASAVETVTRYRFNPETRLAEAYTVQDSVTRQAPTGRKIDQLKKDVRLDEKTGKFYRWCGLGGAANGTANVATPAQTAALGKLSPIFSVLSTQHSVLSSQSSALSPQSSVGR